MSICMVCKREVETPYFVVTTQTPESTIFDKAGDVCAECVQAPQERAEERGEPIEEQEPVICPNCHHEQGPIVWGWDDSGNWLPVLTCACACHPTQLTCEECGTPDNVQPRPALNNDWVGGLPLCDTCYGEYWQQADVDQAHREGLREPQPLNRPD